MIDGALWPPVSISNSQRLTGAWRLGIGPRSCTANLARARARPGMPLAAMATMQASRSRRGGLHPPARAASAASAGGSVGSTRSERPRVSLARGDPWAEERDRPTFEMVFPVDNVVQMAAGWLTWASQLDGPICCAAQNAQNETFLACSVLPACVRSRQRRIPN